MRSLDLQLAAACALLILNAACGDSNGNESPHDAGADRDLAQETPDDGGADAGRTPTDGGPSAGKIIVAPDSSLRTTEAGGESTIRLSLDKQPTANVEIPVTSSDENEGTASTATVIFTPSDWNSPKTVTVRGVDDDVADGPRTYSVAFGVARSEDVSFDGIDPEDVSLTNDDDDKAAVVLTTPLPDDVTTESGGSIRFTVRLASKPKAPVVIPIATTEATEGKPAVASLTFTPNDWGVAQAVSVQGQDDATVDGERAYRVVVGVPQSKDAAYAELKAQEVALRNADDDAPAFVIGSPSPRAETTEQGGIATFTVRLAAKPTAGVTVPLSSSKPSEGTVSPAELVFGPDDFDVPKIVTVTGQDDDVDDDAQSYSVMLGVATGTAVGYAGVDPPDVTFSNLDDDIAAIVVSTPSPSATTTEYGGAVWVPVRLQTKPTSNVTISVSSSDSREGVVSEGSLVFTPSNWNTVQTVFVTGQDDSTVDGNRRYSLVFGAASSIDAKYDGMTAPQVELTNVDNDTASITVSPTSLVTTESGGVVRFRLVASSKPSADIVIPVSSSNTAEGTVTVSSVTFTPADWNTVHDVYAVGVDDDIDDGDITYQVIFGAATSADPNYGGLDLPDLTVTNKDDDTVGVIVGTPQPKAETHEWGGQATVDVRLASKPSSNVTVPVSVSSATEAEASTTLLTFTPSNWSSAQTITVTGKDDGVEDLDAGYLLVLGATSSADASYTGIDPADVFLVNRIPVRVYSGLSHRCARLGNGRVKCWGDELGGALGVVGGTRGDGANEMGDNLPFVDLGTGRIVESMALGGAVSCAIVDDDSLRCWGKGTNGILGSGDSASRTAATNGMGEGLPAIDLGAGRTAKSVAAGTFHVCAILDDDSLKCWGYNGGGALGLGDTSSRGDEPGEMGDALPHVNLGAGRTARAVAIGESHTCALLDDGHVKCWGFNLFGQLGLNDTVNRGDAPGEMGDALPSVWFGEGRTAIAITVGAHHSGALLADHSLWCWGLGLSGQLLDQSAEQRNGPVAPIDFGAGRSVKSVTSGQYHVCAILDDDSLKCWGSGQSGANGFGTVTNLGDQLGETGAWLPVLSLGAGRRVRQLSAGESSTCAMLDRGGVKCWGENKYGQLGLGDTASRGDNAGELGDALPFVELGTW